MPGVKGLVDIEKPLRLDNEKADASKSAEEEGDTTLSIIEDDDAVDVSAEYATDEESDNAFAKPLTAGNSSQHDTNATDDIENGADAAAAQEKCDAYCDELDATAYAFEMPDSDNDNDLKI